MLYTPVGTLDARDFSSAVSGFPSRPTGQKMCRPLADTENSHCTREKPLVPRVVRWVRKVKKFKQYKKSVIILSLDPNPV